MDERDILQFIFADVLFLRKNNFSQSKFNSWKKEHFKGEYLNVDDRYIAKITLEIYIESGLFPAISEVEEFLIRHPFFKKKYIFNGKRKFFRFLE